MAEPWKLSKEGLTQHLLETSKVETYGQMLEEAMLVGGIFDDYKRQLSQHAAQFMRDYASDRWPKRESQARKQAFVGDFKKFASQKSEAILTEFISDPELQKMFALELDQAIAELTALHAVREDDGVPPPPPPPRSAPSAGSAHDRTAVDDVMSE